MTQVFERSTLWRQTLAARDSDEFHAERSMLRSAYFQFRASVEPLAAEIARSMPMFTDHSILHIDSLWDTASIVCGDRFPLNPAEAFVLGGAFLLHDLGMGLVAYPDGEEALKRDPQFSQLVETIQRRLQDDLGVSADDSRATAEDEALVKLLRLRHAAQGERLVTETFSVPGGATFYLLQDTVLRQTFGKLIGQIAHSHWWSVDELGHRFSVQRGSMPDHPAEWTVDPLKIACVLRLADAAHIDNRRAPTFLHAFRKPSGDSADHWYFQQRLARPLIVDDRLRYTSNDAFEHREASAWWLAFETVQMIDNELRRVDSLCADLGRPRFAAKSVAGADAPVRFAHFVPTAGWEPIDARLTASQVAHLVGSLGGVYLYGDRPIAAVRELLANAADATKARLAAHGGSDAVVTLTLDNLNDQWWLTVEDNGIGMDSSTLVSGLTDFGRSSWKSESMLVDYPQLLGSAFSPTGRFGIGFFSVFMLASKVRVTSLKYFDSPANTHVLDFPNGLRARPLLRAAEENERLRFGGTRVELCLEKDPTSSDGLLPYIDLKLLTPYLEEAIAKLCALSEVDIDVKGPGELTAKRVVRANDWRHIPLRDLFDRVYIPGRSIGSEPFIDRLANTFSVVATDATDADGKVRGRAMLAANRMLDFDADDYYPYYFQRAHVYVGGFAAAEIHGAVGVFEGYPLKADRFSAFPVLAPRDLQRWVREQLIAVRPSLGKHLTSLIELARTASAFGVDAKDLPCALVGPSLATPEEAETWAAGRSDILLIERSSVGCYVDADDTARFFNVYSGRTVDMPMNGMLIDSFSDWIYPKALFPRPVALRVELEPNDSPEVEDVIEWWNTAGCSGTSRLTIEAISRAWEVSIPQLLRGGRTFGFWSLGERVDIPYSDGNGCARVSALLLSRPGDS